MKRALHTYVKKCGVLMCLGLSTYLPSFSQSGESSSFLEAGVTIGPSNFLGDLGGNSGKGTTFLKDNNFPMTKLIFGIYGAWGPSELFGFRLAVNHGSLAGDDAVIKGKGGLEEARKYRNQNFQSKITEAMLMGELYPTVLLEQDPSDVYHKLRPYGMLGIGIFNFNPQGTDPMTGQWVNLHSLRTEGQGMAEYPDRKPYKLTQINIPLGAGVKYFVSESMSVAMEILHRKTQTDYIDDVSTNYIDPALFYQYLPGPQAQLAERMANKSGNNGATTQYPVGFKRGTSSNNDAYFSINLKLGFRLGGGGDRWNNSTRCPIRF